MSTVLKLVAKILNEPRKNSADLISIAIRINRFIFINWFSTSEHIIFEAIIKKKHLNFVKITF